MLYSRKALLAFIAAAAISTTPGCECEDNTSTKETKVNPGGNNDTANTKPGGNNDTSNTQGGNNDTANTKPGGKNDTANTNPGGNNDMANTKGNKVATKKEDLSAEDKVKYETAEKDKQKFEEEKAKLPKLETDLEKAERELEAVQKTIKSVHDAVLVAKSTQVYDKTTCTVVDKMEGNLTKAGLEKCDFGKSFKWEDLQFDLHKAVEDKDGDKVKGWKVEKENEKKKFRDLGDGQKGLKEKVKVLSNPIDNVATKLQALGDAKSGTGSKLWLATNAGGNVGENAHFNLIWTTNAADGKPCNASDRPLKDLFKDDCAATEPVKNWTLFNFLRVIADSTGNTPLVVPEAKLDARKKVLDDLIPAEWDSFDLSKEDKYKDLDYFKQAKDAVVQATAARDTLKSSLTPLEDKHNKSKGDLDLVKPEENQTGNNSGKK